MIAIVTLFYLSLGIMIAMMAWKTLSLRNAKLSLIEGEGVEKEFHSKMHGAVYNVWETLRSKYLLRFRSFLITLFYTVVKEILHLFLVFGRKLKVHHGKWYDMVKGKEVLRKKGAVSFFLRDVAEYKKQLKGES